MKRFSTSKVEAVYRILSLLSLDKSGRHIKSTLNPEEPNYHYIEFMIKERRKEEVEN